MPCSFASSYGGAGDPDPDVFEYFKTLGGSEKQDGYLSCISASPLLRNILAPLHSVCCTTVNAQHFQCANLLSKSTERLNFDSAINDNNKLETNPKIN